MALVEHGYQREEKLYHTLCTSITTNFQVIQKHVNKVKTASKNINTTSDSPLVREHIHTISLSIGTLCRETEQLIKEFMQLSKGNSTYQQTEAKLVRDFKEVMQQVNTVFGFIQTKIQQTNALSTSLEEPTPWDHQTDDLQRQLLDDNSALIHERDEGIRAIATSMEEVNSIMQDLLLLIQEQGEGLDNIEHNMTNVETLVDKGVGQLGQAARYQKQSWTKLCCILFIVVVIAAILGIILGVKLQ